MNFFKSNKEKPELKPILVSNGRKFRKEVNTMQDDIGGMVAQKNGSKLDKEMQRNLTQVYTDGDGHIPDLTKLEKNTKPVWKRVLYWLIGILAVLLVVGVSGFWFFLSWENNKSFTNESVMMRIEPPITIVSGQEATYTVKITNNEKVNLYNLNIQLFYPDNFTVISASPQPGSGQKNIWDISILKVGETQTIELKGKLLAPLNSVSALKGLMTFKPANLNADFKQ
ncbi:MAG: hypothetical protein AAB791_02285, partial [Patescibacteria group bacterium]